MNYRMISYIIGCIWLFEAVFLLVPVITALAYGESAVFAFLQTILVCLGVGALLTFRKPKNQTLRARDGFVVVSLSWIAISLLGALPFMFTGVTSSYVDALFETVSGFTTTGATIFAEVESLPKSILMWRSFTHWIGGMGVLVFIMAFVPLSGGRNMHIMKAESTGPDVGKLVPRVRTTAMLLYCIYLGFTLLQFVLLLFGRMSAFEALTTTFSTAGTGGFGVKNDSLLGYSAYVQIVVTIFMLLFSLNFGSYFLALRGKFKDAFSSEVRTFLVVVLAAIVLIVVNIVGNIATDPALQAQFKSTENLGDIIRHVAFSVASIISTTGFATVDFDLWPAFACTILVLVMFVGACAGSTGGGLKVSRILLLFKGFLRDLRAAIHPKQVKQITVDKKPVGQAVMQATFSYFACFMVVFAISVMLLAVDGYDFTTNFTAVAATVNNIGPGLSGVGPTCNYAFFSPLSKIVMMFDMLVGRLELFPMLILFMPSTWKK